MRHSAAQRPRRRSEAKVVERAAKWQAKLDEKARQRRALFFEALPIVGMFIRRAAATGRLHASCPVEDGVKWAANKWVWNKRFF